MGLGFSHGGAHWSYSGFNLFRKRLAQSTGIDLTSMQGYLRMPLETIIEIAANTGDSIGDVYDRISAEEGPKRSWDEVQDSIKYLLNHSDCDGSLGPKECLLLAPRLREIVQGWSDNDFLESYDKQQALMLANGLEEAAANNEHFRFR